MSGRRGDSGRLPDASAAASNAYHREICELTAFREALHEMRKADPELARSIRLALLKTNEPCRAALQGGAATDGERMAALLQEQIHMSAQANKYGALNAELSRKTSELWKFAVHAPELFFGRLFAQMDEYFETKKRRLAAELEREWEWYSSIADMSRKVGGAAIGGIQSIAESLSGRKLERPSAFDERTVVERILEKHLSPAKVGADLTRMMEKAGEEYRSAWQKHLLQQVPNVRRISGLRLAEHASAEVGPIAFQMGHAEQSLFVGMTSAVIGTAWLAAGWHTLAYAMMNVFPPLAVFTAVVTFVAGAATKEQAVRQRKKQLDEAVNSYYAFFLTKLDFHPIPELGGVTLRKHMMLAGEKIVEQTVKEWEKHLFGALAGHHYEALHAAFQRHLMYVEEAIYRIKSNPNR
ncbi:hypothetical protein [Paenibacillus sp.]|uniref:hypothetical protein n=1 Tax=Paenibacillus sp. TaxID=58172 RepID=UPI0028124378|nr:hypothetical protein [Paenibacillus sp.]